MLGQKSVFGSFCLLMILPLALFAAAAAAYAGYIELLMPRHTIIMLAVLLLFAAFFAPQNEYCQGAKLLKNSELFAEHLRDLIEKFALKIGNTTKASASLDDFFEGFLHELKPLNFGAIASAIFPMLGILGTFLSIALSMPDFSSSDQGALEREISELLGGIATAFYVSIYGIFLSIWWMLAARVGRGKISAFKARIQRNYGDQFWRESDLAAAQFALAQSQNERFAAALKALADAEFFEQLKRLHSEKFALFSSLFRHIDACAAAQCELSARQLALSEENERKISASVQEFLASQQRVLADFSAAAKCLDEQLLGCAEWVQNASEQAKKASLAMQKTANLCVQNLAACSTGVAESADKTAALAGATGGAESADKTASSDGAPYKTGLAKSADATGLADSTDSPVDPATATTTADPATATTADPAAELGEFARLHELKAQIAAMSAETKDLLEKITQRE